MSVDAERKAPDRVDVARFLEERRRSIVDDAAQAARRAHLRHYEAEGFIEQRLPVLFDMLIDSISKGDLSSIVAYCRGAAAARFTAGFDLSEVQTAFNVLEEATWRHALEGLSPVEFAFAIGLVSTALGAGKDALARAYVSHAAQVHAPSLDLSRLAGGTDDDPWLDL
jgi:hypothetical protein